MLGETVSTTIMITVSSTNITTGGKIARPQRKTNLPAGTRGSYSRSGSIQSRRWRLVPDELLAMSFILSCAVVNCGSTNDNPQVAHGADFWLLNQVRRAEPLCPRRRK